MEFVVRLRRLREKGREEKQKTYLGRLHATYIGRSETNTARFAEGFPHSNRQRVSDSIQIMETFQEDHIDKKT